MRKGKYNPLNKCLALALLICALDQLSKILVLTFLSQQVIPVVPTMNLHLTFNYGAAFGMLSDAGGWQKWFFVGVAVLITLFILLWSKKLSAHEYNENIALACVLGGAWGNLLDRVRLGGVVDFFDFYIGNWHWYTFNLADAAICIGAVIIAYKTLSGKKHIPQKS